MNERIKFLAELCMVEVKNVPVTGSDGWTSLETVRQIDPEKFALLIVRECALQCRHNDDMDRIEKHFGVEE